MVGLLVVGIFGVLFYWPNDLPSLALLALTIAAGFGGRGKRWAEEALGVNIEIVRKPLKPTSEKVARIWAKEWAKESKKVD